MSRTVGVKMPRLGESVTGGTIVRWHVAPGATVKAFETVVEVDTDKVSTEIPSPVSGIVRRLLVGDGDPVEVGADIALIEVEETAGIAPTAPQADSRPPNTSGDVGTGTTHASEHPRYSPVVRELAREHAIDLGLVAGSGEGGRVTRNDVIAFMASVRSTPTATSPSTTPRSTSRASASAEVADGDERVALTHVRRLIAERMTLSKTSIPHAWQAQEVDMSGVTASRAANKARFTEREGFSLTYLPYVVAACAASLRKHRSVNATFTRDQIVLHRAINIGIPMGLEDGVIAPVIRNTDELSIAGLARGINDLTVRARSKKLSAADLGGATFTVNNSGTFGTVVSYSVIDPGQAGILTMAAVVDRVVAIERRIAVRPMMFLCFSLDHRILDGLEAARFLSACREWLEGVNARTAIY